jgi:hypothetical protein
MITVKELREQLERVENAGMGDAFVWFRDWNDFDHKVEQGIYDTHENNIVLG